MKTFKDDKDNALLITDSQVQSDWTLGMKRSLANLLTNRISVSKKDKFNHMIHLLNNDRELSAHVSDTVNYSTGSRVVIPGICSIAKVADMKESSATLSYGDTRGSTYTVSRITAKVTCDCGVINDHIGFKDFDSGSIISAILSNK